jgi:hypothetical protein
MFLFCSLEETDTIELNEEIVNLGVKLGPCDFELKKVLGKGGYGKVFQVKVFVSFVIVCKFPQFPFFSSSSFRSKK